MDIITTEQNPLVSVMISTYNRAHLLGRAVNSVLNQTYKNLELLIVDDASTDRTEQIVTSFKDSRIIYHRHAQNKGVLAAKNTGFDLKHGEYCCRLDDDDELLPQALEVAVSKLIELGPKGVKIVIFDAIEAETGKLCGHGLKNESYLQYEDLLCGRVYGDWWSLMHKDYIGANRFDEALGPVESMLWLKLYRECKGYYFPVVLQRKYRHHGGERVSNYPDLLKQAPRLLKTREFFLKEYGNEIKSLCPKRYGQQLGLLAYYQLLSGNKSAARSTLRESFTHGFLPQYYILYFLSFILGKKQIVSLYNLYIRFAILIGSRV